MPGPYELYLIRHGAAEERGDAWPDDTKRPLTEEGMNRLRKGARGLAALGVSFDVVLTNAYRRIDDRQYELVQKMDGKVVVTARLSLSADGRTITTVTTSQTGSATTIHEKR